MTRTRTELDALRDRALALAPELGLDPNAWYLRVLAATRVAGEPADLGALVRAYWELQRVTGRTDPGRTGAASPTPSGRSTRRSTPTQARDPRARIACRAKVPEDGGSRRRSVGVAWTARSP
jgi:hypothetical protein